MNPEKPIEKIELTFVCNEDWDKMKPNDKGRHCDVCNKTVIDFTKKGQSEFESMQAEAGGKLCGRFKAKQTIHLPKFKFDKAAAILMATAGLSLLATENKAQGVKMGKVAAPRVKEQPTVKGNIKCPKPTTLLGEPIAPADTIKKIPAVFQPKTPKDNWEETVMLGKYIIPPTLDTLDTLSQRNGDEFVDPLLATEPEFKGGFEALNKYLDANIRWPEKLGHNVSVFVQVQVSKEGKVANAYIIRGFRDDVDSEALRIARTLAFIPAKDALGNAVDSVFTFPVNFHLK